jgi:uncharacterized small protein (DUF1192 family)
MITITDAIRSLTTGASFTVIGDEINWFSPDITQPTQAEIETEVARLEAEHAATQYQRDRAEAYASIADQLDMQYWDSVNGTTIWADHIAAVKAAHPKP